MSLKRAALSLLLTISLGASFGGLTYLLSWPLWVTITGACVIGGLFGFSIPVIRR